jgi:hypothetical protein
MTPVWLGREPDPKDERKGPLWLVPGTRLPGNLISLDGDPDAAVLVLVEAAISAATCRPFMGGSNAWTQAVVLVMAPTANPLYGLTERRLRGLGIDPNRVDRLRFVLPDRDASSVLDQFVKQNAGAFVLIDQPNGLALSPNELWLACANGATVLYRGEPWHGSTHVKLRALERHDPAHVIQLDQNRGGELSTPLTAIVTETPDSGILIEQFPARLRGLERSVWLALRRAPRSTRTQAGRAVGLSKGHLIDVFNRLQDQNVITGETIRDHSPGTPRHNRERAILWSAIPPEVIDADRTPP